MLLVQVVLVFAVLSSVFSDECAERCARLKRRSLNRVKYDDDRVIALFERQRPLESMKDVCWRLYDNIDCMKKCKRSDEHATFAKMVKTKCKFVLHDMEPTLKCISKHQSFLKMKCKSYIDEASKLRPESSMSLEPSRDACQYLHLNTICLENNINNYCPNGKLYFRRLKMRDYFLSFVLPTEDKLFDDQDLESCQMFDFIRDEETKAEEEKELRKEQEKRLRIEDEDHDYDYEEELTTVVNGMENEKVETSTSVFSPSTLSSTSTSQINEVTPDTKEFTAIIDDLIDSAQEEKAKLDISTTPETEDDYLEEDEEYNDDNSTRPTINVVAIEDRKVDFETTTQMDPLTTPLRLTPPKEETTTPKHILELTTKVKKVFSDDSMEDTPPNFFYSSVRYDTTTRSNYVVDNIDKSEKSEPMEIDTSTLFGIEGTTIGQTEKPTTDGNNGPWINEGGVVVKPILGFNEKDVDEEEEREQQHREKLKELDVYREEQNIDESSEEDNDSEDHQNVPATEKPSTSAINETIITISLVGFVFCLILIIIVILLTYFCTSARRSTYNVHKNDSSAA